MALTRGTNREADLTQEEIEEINKRYTMQEERNVHQRFIVQIGDSMDADDRCSNADNVFEKGPDKKTDKDNDLGDNVEFF